MERGGPREVGGRRTLLSGVAVGVAVVAVVVAVALTGEEEPASPPEGGSSPTTRPAMTVQPDLTGPEESQFGPSGPPMVTPTEPPASDIGSPTP